MNAGGIALQEAGNDPGCGGGEKARELIAGPTWSTGGQRALASLPATPSPTAARPAVPLAPAASPPAPPPPRAVPLPAGASARALHALASASAIAVAADSQRTPRTIQR